MVHPVGVTRDSVLPLLTVENVTQLSTVYALIHHDSTVHAAVTTLAQTDASVQRVLPRQFGVIQDSVRARAYELRLPAVMLIDAGAVAAQNTTVAAYFQQAKMDPQHYGPLLTSLTLALLTNAIADKVYADDQGTIARIQDTMTVIGKNAEFLRSHPELQKTELTAKYTVLIRRLVNNGGMGGDDALNP
jgi:hypothetical protein